MKLNTKIATNSTDENLMELLCLGNKRALELLYDRYFAKLCHFASTVCNNANAEDMVQDVFIKLIHQPQQFNAHFKFKTWIYTLVRNQCRNDNRNLLNREFLAKDYFQPETIAKQYFGLETKETLQMLNKSIQQLSKKEKEIFYLKYEHEMPYTEIAEFLEIPVGTVKSAIFNLLKKLSNKLNPQPTK